MTTTTERRWPLAEALPIAQRLRTRLSCACARIEIAGSIRRCKRDVGDVELLAIPRLTSYQANFFGLARAYDHLEEWVKTLIIAGDLAYRPTTHAARTYGKQNKLLIDTVTGMSVDIFSTTAQNWGMALMVRTGPKDWNVRFMARLQQLGCRGHAYSGVTGADGVEHNCPDEETVFRFLGWAYIPPESRT